MEHAEDRCRELERQLAERTAELEQIAIENVRLSEENQARNAEITAALEQQTATAEILRVIRSSPTDLQPVFDAILEHATRLCDAQLATVGLYDGEKFEQLAQRGGTPDFVHRLLSRGPYVPVPGSNLWQTIQAKRPIHIDDVTRTPRVTGSPAVMRDTGAKTLLSVPMLKEGQVVGHIGIYRREIEHFTQTQIDLVSTFANQAVIAIENVRLFTELQTRNAELSASLEQQAVNGEILRIISSSPNDTQPVFDAIVNSGRNLFFGMDVSIRLVVGKHHETVASTRPLVNAVDRFPLLIENDQDPVSHAMLRREVVQVPDFMAQDGISEIMRKRAESRGYRASLCAPMLKEGIALGAIIVLRATPGPFTDKQIALLKTFADQAVIAIENVRLFKELQAKNAELTDSLEQQTATSEILRIISKSPNDTQPVFDAIVKSAVRLFDGMVGLLHLGRGDHTELVASTLPLEPGGLPLTDPRSPAARTIFRGEVVQINDIFTEDVPDRLRQRGKQGGFRSLLSAPLLREGKGIGALQVSSPKLGPFTDKQISLLQTFADQAVIAIENARLFRELQARNAELTESLEQQTATSEILRIISGSPTDIQPVLDAVAESAARLCNTEDVYIRRIDAETTRIVAHVGKTPLPAEGIVRPLQLRTIVGTVAREGKTIHIVDVTHPHIVEKYPDSLTLAARYGVRTLLYVPLLREGVAIGVIAMRRREVRPFTDKQIKLLETFADQAVIAIENVRLFNEVKARTEELTRSVEEMRALGEVGQAVSSTLDLQTVLVTVISNAVELSKADGGGTIYEFEEATEVFEPRASHGVSDAYVQALHELRIRLGESAVGMCAVNRSPYQVPDVEKEANNRVRDTLLREGIRSVLALPILREERVMGALVIRRKTPGTFSQMLVTLLQNFASQSVLAIENARLFHQIQSASDELRAASQHKSEFLANMSHELRTPLNAVIGFSEVLQQRMFGELNDKQNEYIEYIHKSGSHLLSLINDILDLSKVEAGRMELDVTSFNVPMAIDNALTLVKERATRHGLTLDWTLDPAVAEIQADERKFKQVILNLLSNAVKFTPEGGRITVAARPVSNTVEISVADTGIGIAPEDCDAVFEEFRQVGSSSERKAEGTGLGLALTKKFIELHGGRIWLTSALGKGSTFFFTMLVSQPTEAVA